MLRRLLSLIRFSHTLFALPFALLAAMMAWNTDGWLEKWVHMVMELLGRGYCQSGLKQLGLASPVPAAATPTPVSASPWHELVGILFCMVFARSAAMAFNRLADRKIDAANPRTAGRHLATGELSVPTVAVFALACCLGFVASTVWFLPNWLPLCLSVPVLAFLLGYSYTKRFTATSHFWLGTALALSPVAAWIAVRGEAVLLDPLDVLPAIVLGLAVLTWVAGFDIIYACQDVEFDRQAKLSSIPARLGVRTSLHLAAACHLAMILALVALCFVYPAFDIVFWCSIAVVAVFLSYEHFLVRPDDLTRVNIAFFHVNAIISIGLFVAGTLDLCLGWWR